MNQSERKKLAITQQELSKFLHTKTSRFNFGNIIHQFHISLTKTITDNSRSVSFVHLNIQGTRIDKTKNKQFFNSAILSSLSNITFKTLRHVTESILIIPIVLEVSRYSFGLEYGSRTIFLIPLSFNISVTVSYLPPPKSRLTEPDERK